MGRKGKGITACWAEGRRGKVLGAVVFALALSLLTVLPVQAATVLVATPLDSGPGSLRRAIATARPGDTIMFSVRGTILLTSGALVLNKNLTIAGPGAEQLTISGNGTSRVFRVTSGVTATIEGVTISAGQTADSGGGIFNQGTLIITTCILSGNTASGFGGALMNSGGVLTINDSTLAGNSALHGGGLANSGTLDVTNSTFEGNSASDNGGGLYNAAKLTITDSTLTANFASDDGGGLANSGTLNVTNSTFAGNSAVTAGGIHNNAGTLTVTNCVLSDNTADLDGGGLFNTRGGPLLTIDHSTLSGNTAVRSGGGLFNEGLLIIDHSTLSRNTTSTSTHGSGGGIYNNEGSLTVIHSTLAGNSAYLGGGFYNVVHSPFETVTFKHAIVAKSHSGGNCFQPLFSRPFEVAGVSFATDDTCPGFKRTTATRLALGPLADNGGPTQTHALLPGSRAIDSADLCWVTTDQRGVSRPQGAACDVGAFELE